MTTTPPEAPEVPGPQGPQGPPPGDAGPRVTRDEIRDLGRLRRSRSDRKVAGVAGGLARHLDIDPVILRVLFVVLVFFGGAGLLAYGACWLLLPEDGAQTAPFNLDERSRGFALVVVGILSAIALVGDSWGWFGFPWPLAVVALVALFVLTRRGSRGDAVPVSHPDPGAPPFPPGPPPAGAYPTYAVPMTPRNPRRRGPILFWFTLALIALGVGVLGILDLAGLPIADAAYPALAVGVTGVMLLVGSVYGRAGGLILVGLLASLALAGALVAQELDASDVREAPLDAASVQPSYSIHTGELVLDLSGVGDIENLDGRSIELDNNVGRIEVIVPRGMDVDVQAAVHGPGNISLFGSEQGGIDLSRSLLESAGPDAPTLDLDADLSVGEIEVSYR